MSLQEKYPFLLSLVPAPSHLYLLSLSLAFCPSWTNKSLSCRELGLGLSCAHSEFPCTKRVENTEQGFSGAGQQPRRVSDPQGQKEIARAWQSPVPPVRRLSRLPCREGIPGEMKQEPTEAKVTEPPGGLQGGELRVPGENAEGCRGPWDLQPEGTVSQPEHDPTLGKRTL